MLMFRHFSILCIAACSLWSAVFGLLFVACSGGSSGVGGGNGNATEGVVKLFLGKLQVPVFDSISVDVSAADMTSIHISKKILEDNLKIEGIPRGETRRFEVKIYADSGVLVQKGEAVADIKTDENITIPIKLEALFGFLRLEVPLGFTNNTGISSGKLFLENKEFNMKFENGKGIFNTNSLPLDKELNLRIELSDADGQILFNGSKSLSLSSILQTETIQLQSTQASVTLELTGSSAGSSQVLVTLPAKSRPPKDYGDLFFTEIYANTPSGDDNSQYMELYNSTSDTLLLISKYCKIVRTDNGTKHEITDLRIPPMSYAIIGRSSVLDKDYSSSFALLKTTMSLGLFCGDSAIDTLTFSSKGDNPFPMKTGAAIQLPLENYENHALGSSWCAGFSPREDAICQ
ncbi:MAG: lamin tail domain-containing protein [Fibromonadales bacterium]|nr:lamin tail domain-containing protein [Fibromonadales bacterium]